MGEEGTRIDKGVMTDTAKSDSAKPLMSRRLLLFMGAMILANISGHMYQGLLPLYVQELGAGVVQVGLFFTLSSVVPLAFQIFGGWLSDAIGRLQAIAIGSLAGLSGYLIYVLAPSWEWLLIATAAGAMGSAFVAPSYLAFIAEESTEATRGRVYGLSTTLFMVVGIIGPPAGGYLSENYGFRLMFLAAGALYLTATVVRIMMARRANREADGPRERPRLSDLKKSLLAMAGLVAAGGVVTWIMISDGVRDIAFTMAFQLEPLYMQNLMGLTNTQIGWLASISSLTTMILMTPAGWLSDKKGERIGIVGGFAIIAAALALFVNTRVFAGFALVWILYGVGGAMIEPAYSALISKVVPEQLRGTAFGLFATSIGLISLPAPYIGGQLWDRFGPRTPFYVPLVATLVLIPVMWTKFKLQPADRAVPGESAAISPELPGPPG
jgi:MFS family permease